MPDLKRSAAWPRYVLVVPLILIGLLVFRFWYPSLDGDLPKCPIHTHTGKHCPGCGGTRSADALVHFRFAEALRQHAWFTLVIFLGLPVLFWMAAKERFPNLFGPRYHIGWLWFCLISLVLFGILRNFEVFNWLAPLPQSAPGK